MSVGLRLDQVFAGSRVIEVQNDFKAVIFSDHHRGTGDKADNFQSNRWLFKKVLEGYFLRGFTYIENGDGDELWENRKYAKIIAEYPEIFNLIDKFKQEKRFYEIGGNHNKVRGLPEGLVFFNQKDKRRVFVVHGNQGDWVNDEGWKYGRFFVRYIWSPLERIGIHDPTSVSKNAKKHERVENEIIDWVFNRMQITIVGHTHTARQLGVFGEQQIYFNDGCVCENAWEGISGVELLNGLTEIVPKFWSKA